ncbi:hypothetical protein PC41400_17760 [Paenibacillus chitinolyticus]|uniref:Uncharacterized protein n=1 Tax=Paenibacillus chitinolyticus TaxID=79263 RepID=A0A410WYY8_9BACL|nr:hypothetical protein [Paenibacillus chitinolyticus]MCY9590614.1 hypothetical protein [Paenibacillus chitinolyticus]MCY9596391.1 hypothetical protein [Paenibacillus chitinolyticus]QAV19412.1 hypothetical protein PC41400_17760 [Paenibacillus chitinolyticus]
MNSVDKIRFMLLYGEAPEANCYGYMELNQYGDMIALYNWYGEEIDMYGVHEFVRVRSLGKFDDEDRDNFYSLLESDGVG